MNEGVLSPYLTTVHCGCFIVAGIKPGDQNKDGATATQKPVYVQSIEEKNDP